MSSPGIMLVDISDEPFVILIAILNSNRLLYWIRIVSRFWSILLIVSGIWLGCKENVEEAPSTFPTLRDYKYQEFSSEQECRSHYPNPYYSCVQRISFYRDGRTEAILEESDILLDGKYFISNNSIEVSFNKQNGTYILNFEITSDSTIRRVDNNTVWRKSK